MNRLHSSVLVVVLLVVCGASPATAQGWGRGWFEKLSGPGPFAGNDLHVTAGCFHNTAAHPFEPLWSDQAKAHEAAWCVDIEYSDYVNDTSRRAAQGLVTFSRYQALAMWVPTAPRLYGSVELGLGIGVAGFVGDTFDFQRPVVPIRATLKPFRFLAKSRSRASGVVQVAYTGLLFPRALTNADFNISNQTFSHHYLKPDNVVNLMFDFSSFFFKR